MSRIVCRVLCIVPFCIIFFIEFISFTRVSLSWPKFKYTNESSSVICRLNILIVADPQLIGYINEPSWIGSFSRWDSDSYLRKSFLSVTGSFRSDLVVFLGDLFDEGSISSDKHFKPTIDRFRNIYALDNAQYKSIFISGDNDVGGETFEPIKPENILRFRTFLAHDYARRLQCDKVSLFEANPMDGSRSKLNANKNASIKVLLTHVSLLTYFPNKFAKQIESSIKPNLVLSAHDHTAASIIKFSNSSRLKIDQIRKDSPIFHFLLPPNSRHLLELQSPTCSYRMGVPNMGFGGVVLDFLTNGSVYVQFGIIWLPSRYNQLLMYVALIIFITFVLAVIFVRKCVLCFISRYFRR